MREHLGFGAAYVTITWYIGYDTLNMDSCHITPSSNLRITHQRELWSEHRGRIHTRRLAQLLRDVYLQGVGTCHTTRSERSSDVGRGDFFTRHSIKVLLLPTFVINRAGSDWLGWLLRRQCEKEKVEFLIQCGQVVSQGYHIVVSDFLPEQNLFENVARLFLLLLCHNFFKKLVTNRLVPNCRRAAIIR